MTVILSIKPKYFDLIALGDKTCEIRRKFTHNADKILFYVSAPVKKVMGECDCVTSQFNLNFDSSISVFLAVHEVKRRKDGTKYNHCLSKKELREYLYNSSEVWSIYINNFKKYDIPKDLKEYGVNRAPQNYCYFGRKPIDARRLTRVMQITKGW